MEILVDQEMTLDSLRAKGLPSREKELPKASNNSSNSASNLNL